MMKTITRADVAETLYQEVGLSRKDSGEILIWFWKKSSMSLLPANDVKLSSELSLCATKPWIGRNPKTGVEAGNFFAAGYFCLAVPDNAQIG